MVKYRRNIATNTSPVLQKHLESKRKVLIFSLIIFLILILVAVSVLFLGPVRITFSDFMDLLSGHLSQEKQMILLNIRLPRILSAILAGAALSLSGTIMQIILRNPLGSPFTLGVSQAAAFGAAFAIVIFGAAGTQNSESLISAKALPYTITFSAFLWSMICTGLVLMIAGRKGAGPEIMVLAGIAAGSLFSAGTTAFQYVADDVELSSIIFWTFGDIGRSSWPEFLILLLIFVPSLMFFIYNLWAYAALESGDENAKSMGVRVGILRMLSMTVASLLTAVTVSFFGIIAFVGLVVPHITRRIIAVEERQVILISAITGALFLLLADTLSRIIISPVILPVGIITSIVGAPLFIYLLLKRMGRKI